MKRNTSQQSLALVALVAIVGGYIGASVSTALVVGPNYNAPSSRPEQQDGNIHRDIETMLRLQERSLAILRVEQEEAMYGAADEEDRPVFDRRDRARAYRWCIFNDYDHPRRLPSCVQSLLNDLEFDGT